MVYDTHIFEVVTFIATNVNQDSHHGRKDDIFSASTSRAGLLARKTCSSPGGKHPKYITHTHGHGIGDSWLVGIRTHWIPTCIYQLN